MKTLKSLFKIVLIISLVSFTTNVEGQTRNGSRSQKQRIDRTSQRQIRTDHHRHDRFRTQPVYRYPKYRYPKHRRVVRTLPRHHVRLVHRGLHYYYYSGIFYSLYGDQYMVVLPPIGFRMSILPVGHVRIIVGPTVYYYHSGIYYTETGNEDEKYEVTEPPVGVVVDELPEDVEKIILEGNEYYEYNNVIYKELIDSGGQKSYEIIYNNSKQQQQ